MSITRKRGNGLERYGTGTARYAGQICCEGRTMIQMPVAVLKPAQRQKELGCQDGPWEQIQARSLLVQEERRWDWGNREDWQRMREEAGERRDETYAKRGSSRWKVMNRSCMANRGGGAPEDDSRYSPCPGTYTIYAMSVEAGARARG